MLETINTACEYLKTRTQLRPKTAIILGTGLGSLADEIEAVDIVPYSEIPGFRTSTVAGHKGQLVFGRLAGKEVMAMQGRLHFYEGYSMKEITFPEKVMKAMGIENLFVSNAAGGLNPKFKAGDIMIITDHINLFPEHPLRGANIDELGVRFPDMGDAYNHEMVAKAEDICHRLQIPYHKGVYVGTQGPSFETVAEYTYFGKLGGDTVGMSTVPEIIVAHWAGIKCFGVSVVSNALADAGVVVTSHEDVQRNSLKAQHNLSTLFREMLKAI